jgi:hypothetical protein
VYIYMSVYVYPIAYIYTHIIRYMQIDIYSVCTMCIEIHVWRIGDNAATNGMMIVYCDILW